MKAKRIFQRIASGVMAGIMLVSTLAVTPSQKVTAADVPSKQDASSAINYATILGRATDFGIVADTFEQKMHMETTLATNTFINKSGNNDVDFIEGTAQFIFGSLGSGSTVPGPIDFGVTTAENFNIETTDSIAAGFTQPFDSEGNFDGNAMPRGHFYFRGTFASKFPGIPFAPHILINTNDENTIKTNVNRIMENAESRSNDISKKASGELKSSYLTDWTEYADASQDSHVVLDLEKEAFENKVVYINVDSKLAKYLAKSEGLRLHKKSSTVVVFNIEDGITNKSEGTPAYLSLRKIAVYVNGKRITSQTGSGGNSNTGDGVTNDDVDREVCQKIIWNIRTKSAISLGTISGTILCPYASSVSIDEQCAGWLVGGKGKHIENNAEFHYIYKGGSQEVMHDGIGEIHFAARKSFTHAWNGQNTEEDTGIFTNAGDYSFNWYETDAKYNTSGVTPTVVKNQATNAIKFPTLHFYTDSAHSSDKNYIANGGNKVFHYVITEVGAGTYKNGVQISNGKVEIELTVKNTNGRLSYTVSSTTYLGDGSVYKQNNNIEMSGVEFTLGAFFNLLSEAPTPADLTISKKDVAGKELPGAVLKLTGKDANGKAVVFDRSKVKLGKDAKMSPATGTTEELIFTSGSEATLIPALPDGEYELEETNAPEGYKVATKIKFKVVGGEITLVSKGAEVLEGKDGKYTLTVIDEAAPKTDLTISKKDVAGKELPGAVLKLTGKDTNGKAVVFDRSKVKLGKDAKMSPATGTTEELIFTSGSEATLIPALPDGEYELEETNAPEGYKVATKIKFKVENGVATLISKGAEVLEGKDGKYTLTVIDEAAPKTDLTISKKDVAGKELPGAVLKLTGKDTNGKAVVFDRSKVKLGKDAKMSPATGTTEELIFTSGSEATLIPALPDGEYELEETNAPEGYKIATKIKFKVANGVITLISKGAEVLEGKDGKYTLTVIDEAKPIEGSTEATIQIEKSVINDTAGSTTAISKAGYEFTLTGTSENAKGKVYSGTTDADGKLTIKISDYDEVGTYEYELKETDGLTAGITYDKTVYKVVVTVEVKDYKFVSPAKVEITKKGSTAAVSQPVKFENHYKAASTKAEIPALKTLSGEGAALKDGQFGFTLSKKGETAVLATARNKADGSVLFTIDYDTPGTYEYVIREVKGSEPGITYDESEFEVTVTVTDDGNGTLKAEVSGSAAAREFKNTYEKKSASENDASFSLKLKKELSGDWSNEKNLKAGDYSFELTIQDSSYYAANKADGSVEFTDIVISGGDGDYDFTLKEVIPEPKVKGMTYDETVVKGKVSVKDGKATVTAPAGDIVFTNKFNYEPSRFDVSLNKVISKIDGESLEGAVIKFTRDDGNFDMRDSRVSATQDGKPAKDLKQTKDFISFTTTKTITVITGIASGEYTMSEVSAPEGFQKAEDIKITIDDNGKVTATGAMSGAIVVMIDDPFPTEPTPTPTPTEPTPGPEEPTVTPTPTGTSTPTPTPKGGKKKVTPTPGGGSGKTVTPTPTPGGSGNGSVTPTPGGGGNGSVTPTPVGGKGGKVTPTPAGGNGSGSNGGGNGSNGGGGKNGRGLDRSPQTGDHNTAGVFAAAGLISLAALAVVTIIEKKKREEQ
ncbi:MAG: hypothetical protein IKR23_06365 [Lachnospiraceae bacterium]|nr:hypothetical protein [Lachnospiraceae bacterium]